MAGSCSSSGKRRYRLVSALGKGGFGAVYRGELLGAGIQRMVAIKLLNQESAGEEDLGQRLRDEARILALVRHRAIVHVEDLVTIQGRWAVVMEFVEGADLKDLIDQGPIPLRPLCEIGLEVASALRVAQQAKDPATGKTLEIIHRDIKPANLRITPTGDVKVLDFGVAQASFEAREAETREVSFGSAGYLAPERFDGRDVPASDVYALGVVFFEALSGRPLGQLSVDYRLHATQTKMNMRALEAAVDGGFKQRVVPFVARMLAYDAEERPEIGEVEAFFQDLLADAPGPWLRKWITGALANVVRSESVVSSGDVRAVRTSRPYFSQKVNAPSPTIAPVGGGEEAVEDTAPLRDEEPAPPPLETGPPPLADMAPPDEDEDETYVPDGAPLGGAEPARDVAAHTREDAQESQELAEDGARSDEESKGRSPTDIDDDQDEEEPKTGIRLVGLVKPGSKPPGAEPTPPPAPPTPPAPPPPPPARRRSPLRVFVSLGALFLVVAALLAGAWVLLGGSVDDKGGAAADLEEPVAPSGGAEQPGDGGSGGTVGTAPAPVPDDDGGGEVPGPEPDDEPEPEPEPGATEDGTTGTVVVTGEILAARLQDPQGNRYSPGEVPAGTYDLAVSFPGNTNVALPDFVVVTAGKTTTVRCDMIAQNCF